MPPDRGLVNARRHGYRTREDELELQLAEARALVWALISDKMGAVALEESGAHQVLVREAHAVLREREERFRSLVEHGSEGILFVRREGTVFYVSPSVRGILGYEPEDLEGTAGYDLVHPEDVDSTRRLLRLALEQPGAPLRAETRVRHQDGRWRNLDVVVTNRLDERGVSAVVGSFRDITDRRRAEQRMAQLAAIVESSDDAIIGATLAGIVTSWNGGAERMYGYTAAEMLGRSLGILAHVERADDVPDLLRRLRLGERTRPLETLGLRKDGSRLEISLSMSPTMDETGRVVGASAITRDISARKQAEEELRQSRAMLEQAQAVAHIGSWASDPDRGGRLWWSRETCRIFGLREDEFDGRVETFFALIHPDDRPLVEAACQAALLGEAPYRIDHRIVLRDGTVKWVRDQVEITRDVEGRPAQVIGVVLDITERKALEARVSQSHGIAAVGRRTGRLLHELNDRWV